jgi:RNA polymerase sigma factor (sigma-70 family)
MQPVNDRELLKKFVAKRDQEAFAELVRRHIDLVYAAARRQLRDPAAVEDATQSVFVLLSNKAHTIRDSEALAGWLLVATRCVVLNFIRTEARRRKHESRAAQMKEPASEDAPQWESIRPMLDEAVAMLKHEDRDAITLRYFKGQSVGDVAAALGVSSDAAQKRVLRAVDRLRQFFARRGVTTTSDALASALLVNVVSKAPQQLSAQVVASVLTSKSLGISKGAGVLLAATQTKVAVGALAAVIAVGIATPVLLQQREAPAQPVPATPQSDWKAKVNSVYGLADNELVKRVLPPFIPERDNVLQSLRLGGRDRAAMTRIDTILFTFNQQDVRMSLGHMDSFDVGDVLNKVLDIWPQDTDIDRPLLATRAPGDWVVRDGSAPAKRLDGVMRHLADIVGAGMTLTSEQMEREVIVVRGALKYTEPLKPKELFPTLHLYPGTKRPAQAWNLSVAQKPAEMLQQVGEILARPMIVEADLADGKAAGIASYKLADFRRSVQIPDGALVDDVLTNLTKQTSLQFSREKRTVPTWRLVKQDL